MALKAREWALPDIVVHLTAGDPVTGLWCDTHALPGRYEVSLYTTTSTGVSRVGTHSGCDCIPATSEDLSG